MALLTIFAGKTALALTIFYLLYRFALSNDKLFKRNRFYLLGTAVMSFVLPWITIPLPENGLSPVLTVVSIVGAENPATRAATENREAFSIAGLLVLMYLVGAALFLIKSALAYFSVFQIIRNALHVPFEKFRIVDTSRKVSPFSFFRWIVIPSDVDAKGPLYQKVIQHEILHSKQLHTLDLLIGEILVALQWFNPFAWLFRRAISENLEYLVDEEMLNSGTDAKEYQYSLLSFGAVGLMPAITNNFNTNLLKKRIVMMNQIKNPRNVRFHNLLIPVCLMFALLLTSSFKKYQADKPINKAPSSVITTDDGQEAFLKYVKMNIRYPQAAAEKNITGSIKVLVTFNDNIDVKDFKDDVASAQMEDIIVVGYMKSNSSQVGTTANEPNHLRQEVERVVKTFKTIPADLKGKTFAISVKFKLQ